MKMGHNQPPAHEALGLEIEDLFATVSGSTAGAVSNDEQEAALDDLLDKVRKARKDADAHRVAEKKPHDEAAKAVQATWKPLLDKCDAAIGSIKSALTPYRAARQKAKEAEAEKARQEAEAIERKAQEALQASEDLEDRFAAEERLKQANKARQVANRIDRAPTGLRSRSVAVVTDYRELLLYIANNDKPALDAWLDEYARKSLPSKLPGVEIKTEKVAA